MKLCLKYLKLKKNSALIIFIYSYFFDLLLKSVQEIISFKILHINCLKIKL